MIYHPIYRWIHGQESSLTKMKVQRLYRAVERFIIQFPRFHLAVLVRRPNPDINKLTFVSLLRPGQVVFDVGANYGYYTELFSRKVGYKGAVYAFEPVSKTFETLQSRCGGLPNVHLYQTGLAEVNAQATMYVPSGDFGQASLAKHQAGSWGRGGGVQEFSVTLQTLDSFVSQQRISKIDFIKVDIEGGELRFISGAEITLRRFRPLLYMEISRAWLSGFGFKPMDVVQALRVLSYTRILTPSIRGTQYSLSDIDASEVESGDYLFVADGTHRCFPEAIKLAHDRATANPCNRT